MMGQLGLSVMIGLLGGNKESAEAFQGAIGKKITALALRDDALRLAFEDGSRIKLYDDGQSCCERRYMTTDDDLSAFIGATLTGAEVRTAPDAPDEYGAHEVAFLVVSTSLGQIIAETHNEHNGYYGGFLVRCAVEP